MFLAGLPSAQKRRNGVAAVLQVVATPQHLKKRWKTVFRVEQYIGPIVSYCLLNRDIVMQSGNEIQKRSQNRQKREKI